MAKNVWENKADEEAARKKWEEEIGWQHLDLDRYCKELTEENKEFFTMDAGEYERKYGWEKATRRSSVIDGKPPNRLTTLLVGIYSGLFSIVNQSAFPSSHSKFRHKAFLDPKKPTITDADILEEMGLSDPNAQELVHFMRLYKRMKIFAQKVRTKTQHDLTGEYHQYEYRGEFAGVDSW